MTQNWPSSFPFQMMQLPPPPPPTTSQHNYSWLDEFLDFSSARRGSHRRSENDSITFVEAPFPEEEECKTSNLANISNVLCNSLNFEGLDDEQLMNMFSDEIAATGPSTLSYSNISSTDPSTPSDRNTQNDDKNNNAAHQEHQNFQPKNEPVGDVDISSKLEKQAESPSNPSTNNAISTDATVDPKRVKRILANRQSAQRSRVRKLQYISELERSVTTFQTEVSALSPRVAFLDHQRMILNVDNSALKQRIAALTQDKIFKDAHQEALRKEMERLRQIYHEQNMKKSGCSDQE
ncbi:hypothetical protein ACH5RR_037606 [Cinchona calisaya]|uniref:BZIP domain-containing protein n=1 Tax=Cinchona calisaya TaxID=153742 RepID=A0ABD2Y6N9_9GENT